MVYENKWYILSNIYVTLCRLGQACNHIAALLFFIEHHVDNEILPTEISEHQSLWLGISLL